MPLSDQEVQLELAKLAETGKTERQKNLTAMILGLASTGVGILNTVLLVTNHSDTVNKVSEAKADVTAQVKKVYDETPSFAQVRNLEEKVDATNLQWKAYKSKDEDDMQTASLALERATEPQPAQAVAK